MALTPTQPPAQTYNITCSGPGPHQPASGILGTSDVPQRADVRCSSPACVKPQDTAVVNQLSLQQKAQSAYQANVSYLAISGPTNAQVVAQVRALTQQIQGLIRLALSDFSGDS